MSPPTKYLFKTQLGKGTFASVYLASRRKNNVENLYAIKEIEKHDISKNSNGLPDLVNEILIMKKSY